MKLLALIALCSYGCGDNLLPPPVPVAASQPTIALIVRNPDMAEAPQPPPPPKPAQPFALTLSTAAWVLAPGVQAGVLEGDRLLSQPTCQLPGGVTALLPLPWSPGVRCKLNMIGLFAMGACAPAPLAGCGSQPWAAELFLDMPGEHKLSEENIRFPTGLVPDSIGAPAQLRVRIKGACSVRLPAVSVTLACEDRP